MNERKGRSKSGKHIAALQRRLNYLRKQINRGVRGQLELCIMLSEAAAVRYAIAGLKELERLRRAEEQRAK